MLPSRSGLTDRRRLIAVVVALVIVEAGVTAAHAAPAAVTPLSETVWLCRPGAATNPCNQDLAGDPQRGATGAAFTMRYLGSGADVTIDAVDADDVLVPFLAPSAPAVDCFYVYPTVDVLPNPLLQLGSLPPAPSDTHLAVALTQVARLASVCRLFVPVYRQAPLLSLVGGVLTGGDADYTAGMLDVEGAWTDYWNHDNTDPVTGQRRGVILLGHSQGTANLITLMQQRFDGATAEREHLVAAYLLGANVQVSDSAASHPDSTFHDLAACVRTSTDAALPTGCIVAYSTYAVPAGEAFDPDAVFGRSSVPGIRILCVNPAAVLTGTAADASTELDAYLPTNRLLEGTIVVPNGHLSLVLSGLSLQNLPAGFVRIDDALAGRCRLETGANGTASWLQVDGAASVVPAGSGASGLGLHVLDYNLALGDLIRLAAAQALQWTENR